MANNQSPYSLLCAMRDTCRTQAAQLPSQKEVQETWSGIGFRLAGVRMVAPMGQISEVFRVPSYTHLPGVKSWVLGVSNFRGQLVPLIDLAGFLGLKSPVPLRNRRVVVLQRDEMVVGVVVDSVEGMQHFLVESHFDQADEEVPRELMPYLVGGYRRDIDDSQVFDFARLLDAETFMQVAA